MLDNLFKQSVAECLLGVILALLFIEFISFPDFVEALKISIFNVEGVHVLYFEVYPSEVERRVCHWQIHLFVHYVS